MSAMTIQPRIEVYEYEANRRYTVDKGTRCVMVELKMPSHSKAPTVNYYLRSHYAAEAMRIAAALWEQHYKQPVVWDLASMLITHTTLEVLCEFRVERE